MPHYYLKSVFEFTNMAFPFDDVPFQIKIQIGDGRRLMKKPFGISSGPTSFGRKTNNKSYYQIDCDIFVTPTIITQPQSGYNSENTNTEQILNVNTLYPQIDINVLKPSAPCETKNP